LFSVFVFAVALTFVAGPVRAQDGGDEEWFLGKPIRAIEFVGLSGVRASDLDGVMNPFRGRLFDYALFTEMQRILWELEYFGEIRPEAVPSDPSMTGVIIRFHVTERPVVGRIVFVGNSGIRRGVLADRISTKARDMVNDTKIHLDEQAIVALYMERGFPDIQVRSELVQSGSRTDLVFHITEGPRVIIREIRFQGNEWFSARTLSRQISLRVKSLVNDGAFSEAALVADRAALVTYYRDRGFVDAAVVDVTQEIESDERGNSLILTFNINEGRQFLFDGITFEGNTIFSDEVLSALVRSRVGVEVNASRLQADFQRIANLYFEHGYIFNSISQEERRNPAGGTVSYHITIVERGRAHIENISVVGNDRTDTDVILREIPLVPGDIFSRGKVEEAWLNLMNLRFFSVVIPETPPGSADGLMDLVFAVEEQSTRSIQFGLTFSGTSEPGEFPIAAQGGVSDSNFMGRGNEIGFEANVSTNAVRGSLLYNQRWIFGLPLSGGFDFSVQWNRRRTAMNNTAPFFNGDESYAFPDGFADRDEYLAANRLPPNEFLMDFDQVYFSLGFTSGYRWITRVGRLSLAGGIRTGILRVSYDETLRPFDPSLREGNKTWIPRNSLWTSLSLDTRDLAFDPSRGYMIFNRIDIYGILRPEQEHYMRNESTAQFFLTLVNLPVTDNWNFRITLGLFSGLSFIFPQAGGRPLVIHDANRLAIDGMFSARGWNSEYRNKGHLLWNNWAELRIPLITNILAWDFFFDAAGVETEIGRYFDAGNFTVENMRFGIGGGFRLTIPQLPFRLSLVKRFRVEDGKVQWQPGSAFRNANPLSGLDPVLSISIGF